MNAKLALNVLGVGLLALRAYGAYRSTLRPPKPPAISSLTPPPKPVTPNYAEPGISPGDAKAISGAASIVGTLAKLAFLL